MISRLRGTLSLCEGEAVEVDVQGVGYQVFVSQLTRQQLPPPGSPVELCIHTHVREDALQLYGFVDPVEQRVFEALIALNGFGPRAAMALLSGIEAREFARVVCAGDLARLCQVPGVGKKRAERLVVELKERLLPLAAPSRDGVSGDQTAALRSALAHLGFRPAEIEPVLTRLQPRLLQGAPLDDLLPEALRLLRR